jgi:hypothetical protein
MLQFFFIYIKVKDDTTLSCGRHSQIASTVYQLQPLLTKKYSVVMEVSGYRIDEAGEKSPGPITFK